MKGIKVFLGIMISLLLVVLSFIGWDKYRQQKGADLVEQYYRALKSENYDKAFDFLVLYKEYVDTGEKVDREKAREVYNQKIAFLKSINYKIVDVRDIRVYKNDSLLAASAKLKVQCDGKTIEASESLQFSTALDKLILDYSDDPFSQYRNGTMVFYDVNYKGQPAIQLKIEKAELFHGFGTIPNDWGAYPTDGKTISELVQAIVKSEKAQETVDLNKPNYIVRLEFTQNKFLDYKFWVGKENIFFVFADDPGTVYKFSKGTFPMEHNIFDSLEWAYRGTIEKL